MKDSFESRINSLSGQTTQLCYHCHKCTAGCPTAYAMEYGPDRILRLIQFGQMERILASRDPWLCLECEMCGAHCPNEIDIGEVMIALKETAGEMGYRTENCKELRELLAEYLLVRPETAIDERLCEGIGRLNQLSQTIKTDHNVTGEDNANRLIWSQNLEHIPHGLEAKQGAKVIYFVGCVASFFPRTYRVPQAFVSVLEAGDINFTTLGGQEWCCGYPLLAMGRLEEAKMLIEHNVVQAKALGASRVTFACPSCYHMWKFVYPDVLGEEIGLEVVHATELLDEMIVEKDVELGELELRVTYHDPCDLGRKSGVFDAPRRVLQSIPGLTLVEMGSYGQISECCGGGGNLESFDPDIVSEVGLRRVDRACEGGAEVIVSACQQCERTLTRAVRHHELARSVRMRVADVTELVSQSLEKAISEG
jgi:heterodisulfide reductase subunit D